MMNEHNPIIPEKLPNKAERAAEAVEERGLAKWNRSEQNALRTQGRAGVHSALGRIRQAARKDRKQQFTALYHHFYNPDMLRERYYALKRKAAAGVDGVTWHQYGQNLEENLKSLGNRLKQGAYRAQPSKRSHVPRRKGNAFRHDAMKSC